MENIHESILACFEQKFPQIIMDNKNYFSSCFGKLQNFSYTRSINYFKDSSQVTLFNPFILAYYVKT